MTDLEHAMKSELDGKFHSFSHGDIDGTAVVIKTVPPDYIHEYNLENSFLASSKRGAWSRAKQQAEYSARIWTEDRVAELTRLRALGYGSKKLHRVMDISRGQIEGQLKRMGLFTKRGVPFSPNRTR